MTLSDDIQPPQPPPFARKVQVPLLQVVGVALLSLLPICALTGAFGSITQASERGGSLELQVRYPDRLRYLASETLELSLRNTGPEPLAEVTLRVPEAYLAGFSDLQYLPQPERLTAEHAEIVLRDLQPGQTRRVAVQLRGDKYGRQHGRLTASAGGEAPLGLTVSTFVLP